MQEQISIKRLLWASPLAGVAAALVNAIVFYIASAAGAIPPDIIVPNANEAITVVPVMMASFMAAIAAGIILAILAVLTRRPAKYFIAIAVIMLVLSFYTPLTIPEAIIPMILVLNMMHVVAAAVIVWILLRLGSSKQE
ncbi:MAG: DUF6069 family protein [Cyclobacteriaceae bacterium]